MRFRWDKKYLYWGVTAFAVITASILFFLFLSKLSTVGEIIGKIIGVLKPVLYGFVFAYILNPLLKTFERPVFFIWGEKIFSGKPDCERKAKSFSRCLGIFLTFLLVLLILTGLLWMVLPRLYESLETLVLNLNTYFLRGRELIIQTFPDGSEMERYALNLFDNLSVTISQWLGGDFALELKELVIQISSGIYNFLREILNILVGFIVAVYMLVSKERFSAQCKKVIYSIFDLQQSSDILEEAHEANSIFSGFISGKLLDSLIIGILCYIILTIFRIPYKELISVIIGVTNVIPFFGPFIGALPSAFLILLINPMQCLTFIIIILVLQQFDGNILGPKILGSSTGLGSFWVICAILVGGGLFGFVGMLIGVPVFAIIYNNVKHWVERSLKKKGVPVKTSEFRKISHMDPVSGEPVYMEEAEEKCTEDKMVQKDNEE